ncbi:MAG: hypothetical protein DRQ01_00600 [Ignavibacteriae bacterium]|nr:MAG: hypothetical protein DRQ01_00600 [Ignavibacteriota bacterium]
MKTILIFVLFFLPVSVFSQVWQQTAGTPEGSGATDMLVRQSNLHIFVTTGSFNWPSGDMGGARRSTDDGATWENLNDVFIARTIIDGADGNLYSSIWDFPQDESLYRSTDNGDNWGNPLVTVPSGDNIFSIAVNISTNPNTIFAGTRNGPLRSTDNGINWAPAVNGIPPNSWVRDVEVDSGGYVVAATTNGMFTSTNNGDLWEEATGIAAGDTIVKLIFDYPLSTEKAGGDTRVLAGSDDGNIYEAFRNSRYTTATLLAIFDGEFSGIYIAYLQTQNKKVHGVSHFPRNGQGSGFSTSTNDGSTWQQNNQGLSSDNISALAGANLTASIKYNAGLFDNMNGGAKIFSLDYSTSDVEPVSNLVPDDYELKQNYPNPFNPGTTIQFSIPQEGFVSLDVFNSLGEKVSTLVSENLIAGTYKYDWNASVLPSGIYFCSLTADNFKLTKKLVLMK